MELMDYEKRHIDYLRKHSGECALFLRRNDEFPLEKPGDIIVIGNGGRNTIKGGTGSGDVVSRFFINVIDGLENNGFNVISKDWHEKYLAFLKTTHKSFIKETKALSRKTRIGPWIYSMGFFDYERNYDISCDYEGDVAIYVLSRNSGEGNDRRNIKGDVKLSDKELNDILYLNKKHKKFMLVLNVGGVIDLSPLKEVRNILLLSQLGAVTSDILADILLGKVNPSGKLATTWARPEDYPYFDEFGDTDDTNYKEGIYVGYRYFLTNNTPMFYPFGYGLSYTDFKFEQYSFYMDNNIVTVKTKVTNIGNFSGKEVMQLYISKPSDVIDNPSLELIGYKKSKELQKDESEEISISFDITKFACYDTTRSSYILPKGKYVILLGNSAVNVKPIGVIKLNEEIITERLLNKCGTATFKDYIPNSRKEFNTEGVPSVTYHLSVETKRIEYKEDDYIHEDMNKLTNEELAYVVLGHHVTGFAAIIGSSCKNVIGGAGETVLRLPQITKSITMADGPAGVRLMQKYCLDKNGNPVNLGEDPIMEKMANFIPSVARPFIIKKKKQTGEVHYQNTTPIPIGTALAQSFNDEFVKACGDLVAEEMEMFNVDLWLAPALNIHRNILCGRNFEYYSEDPYLSGMMAKNITLGVQAHKGRGVTVKHFACNNQELNRNNNNSVLSERALREIYLKGFELCIKEARPLGLMTSYNLINGTHTSESHDLINDILRCEWNYDGLIMTDWISSGRSWQTYPKYPAPYASNNVIAGNDLTMSGAPADYKDILKALKSGKLDRETLLHSASRIYRSIISLKE